MKQNKQDIERDKIFTGICLALLPTAFSFILVSNILNQLKNEFILTNADVGYIGGAALWGMSISLLTIGPFLEKIGLKNATKGAFAGHLSGVTLFLVAYYFAGDPSAFWILFMGAIGMGIGNGMIEVAGNPLTAALYPDNKTTKLNHFHGFYMGGLVLGGLIGWGMSQIGYIGSINIGHWTAQISIVYIPIIIYGYLLFPRTFPNTETAQAGIPAKEMFKYTFSNLGVLGLIFFMMFTLAMEMGPMRWIPDVLQAAGLHGMLVLVWISGIMFLLRVFAEPFVEKFSPTGMLLGASFLTGIGLLMFSFIETGVIPLMTAGLFFAVGIAFFVPNMIGLMSERFPKAGSLGIVLLIGMGFVGGGISNAVMGEIADSYLPEVLNERETLAILEEIEQTFPTYVIQAEEAAGNAEELSGLGFRKADVSNVLTTARQALSYYQQNGVFHGSLTGNALRALIDSGLQQEVKLIESATLVLRPADNYGGRMAFLWVAPIAFLSGIVFIVWFVRDQRRGGYKIEKL
jgi:fucose permease